MRQPIAILGACVAFCFLLSAPSAKASVVFATPGLARDCYLIAEYGLMHGFKEVSPLDVCTAALEESTNPMERAGTLVNRSVVLLNMNLVGRAVVDCRNAVRIDPNLGEGHANLGIALLKQGKYQDALPELDKGIELGVSKPHIAYYSRGLAKEGLKDLKGAYLDYKQAADLMPDFALANAELARFKVTYKPGMAPPAPAPAAK
jgi:tetratricopeptide (TPR) repeat protein